MKKSAPFQFKQFSVAHDKCAMKVNTDGILLGAIADVSNVQRILDMGTGSGLIALMLAQRTVNHCQITALELEENAYQQAVENVKNSAWTARIKVIHGDVMNTSFSEKFDLIVSNPPYFSQSLATRNPQRDLARTVVQSHLDWLNQARKWLSETGKITFILPVDAGDKLIQETTLHCISRWLISPKVNSLPKRVIVTFSPTFAPCHEEHLTIYQQDQQYSEAFKYFTREFYLNM